MSTRSRLLPWLQLLVTLLLLWLVCRTIDVGATAAYLANADRTWLIAALALIAVQQVLVSWRWRAVILLCVGVRLRLLPVAAWIGLSTVAGQILPSTLGTDLARVSASATAVGMTAAARSVIADRLVGLASLLLVAAISGLLLLASLPEVGFGTVPALMFAITVLLILLAGPFCARMLALRLPRAVHCMRIVLNDICAIGNRRVLPLVAAVSAAIHGISILTFLCLAHAVGAAAALDWQFAAVVPIVLLTSAVPVSIGGWGIREAAAILGFRLLGMPSETAFILSAAFGLLLIVVGVMYALTWPYVAWDARERPYAIS